MSSATSVNVGMVTAGILKDSPQGLERETTQLGSEATARQLRLHRLWRFYKCTNYDARKTDWDGNQVVDPEEHDMIAHSQFVPAGYYEAQRHDVPLTFRKPSTPYFVGKVIVNRFTAMLFSQRRNPKIVCEDDQTADWLSGFATATRLWARMKLARTYGGAMGSAGVGFKFVKGKPVVEVFDPRYTTPTFKDRTTKELDHLEVRYIFEEEVQNADGEWETRQFWYRRILSANSDKVWPKVAVGDDGEEPNWEAAQSYENAHNLGEVPAVWIQNQPDDENIDGDSDCVGVYELIEAIDQLQSQAHRGTKANCDPGLVLSSDAEFDEVKKGTGNGLQVEKGGSASYLEMTGSGIDKAKMLVEMFERQIETVSACKLDTRHKEGAAPTATEVEHEYSAMVDQADILREQYGEEGVKPLLEKVLRAARKLTGVRPEIRDDGLPAIVRRTIRLPKGKKKDPDTGAVTYYIREVGQGDEIELEWPEYFTPSLGTVNQAVNAAGKAKTAGVIDQKHAVRMLAQYFNVEDIGAVLKAIKEEAPTLGGRIGFPGGDPHIQAASVGDE